jgi:archaellum biogenesis ATPase FlaH
MIDFINSLPAGKLIEISGKEDSYKTTIMLKAMEEFIERDKVVVYIDADYKSNIDYFSQYVNMDNVYLCQSNKPESVLSMLNTILQTGVVDLVILDSLGNIDGTTVQVKKFISQLSVLIHKAKCRCIIVNQLRYKDQQLIPMYNDSMHLYCSMRYNAVLQEDAVTLNLRRTQGREAINTYLIAL